MKDKLVERVGSYSVNNPELEIRTEKIRLAYEFASKAHEGQLRKSGDGYFEGHCVPVAQIIQKWGIEDEDTIAASLLHDVVEDTDVTLEEIRAAFGDRVARIVDGVSKLKSREPGENVDRETRRKILREQYLEPGVAIVKLADRLHNMSTIESLSPAKQVEKAQETIDVFVPLAESLGMWVVKTDLEDLAFKYLYPEEYKRTVDQIDNDPRVNMNFIANRVSHIEHILATHRIEGEVEVRLGGYWAMYQKREQMVLERQSDPEGFGDINDIVSIRVRTTSVGDSYLFLGMFHKAIREGGIDEIDIERLDEYIGTPRSNGYSALHTNINTSKGALEVAVMTSDMEEFNNWGVVSKMRKGEPIDQYRLKSALIPNGKEDKLRFLEPVATALDLAYAVGPKRAAQVSGVMINGQKGTLTEILPNAAVVEFEYNENQTMQDMQQAEYVLPETRQMMKEQTRAETIRLKAEEGKVLIEGILAPRGLVDLSDLGDDIVSLVLYDLDNRSLRTLQDLYFVVGRNHIVLSKISEVLDRREITKEKLGWSTIVVSGQDQPGIFHELSGCIAARNGNIVNLRVTKKENIYKLRIVFEGIDKDGLAAMKEELNVKPLFVGFRLV